MKADFVSGIFLITRPNHDDKVSYLFEWSRELIEFAKSNNIKFHDLDEEKANRTQVESFITARSPPLIIFNGHGNEDEICGHNNEVIIQTGENEDILKGSVVYALACASAANLGQKVVAGNRNAFIGYEKKFCWVKDASRECSPAKDKFALPFKKASNMVSLELIKGRTAKESYEKSQGEFKRLMREYGASDAEPANESVRFWLFWDMQAQKMLGNPDARFNWD